MRLIIPGGHCRTSSNLAKVCLRGQLRPFSKAIKAPAFMILLRARLRWAMPSCSRRAATAGAAPATPPSGFSFGHPVGALLVADHRAAGERRGALGGVIEGERHRDAVGLAQHDGHPVGDDEAGLAGAVDV